MNVHHVHNEFLTLIERFGTMEIEDAIQHCRDIQLRYESKINQDEEHVGDCIKCASEHKQLEAWLTELLQLRREVAQYRGDTK